MSAYYNENDPRAAAWLRNLIRVGAIADGVVDERSIVDVRPDDLKGFTQCHFFAGIGGWSYALRLAEWPDDRPVWTGSCPCQPFSVAGKGEGENDERHLWPEFLRLIGECRPTVVFGEQVASKAGRVWLARVRADLEALGYGVGAADLCAAGVGAPHIRQRLWWVADAERACGEPWGFAVESGESIGAARTGAPAQSGRCGDDRGVGDTDNEGSQGYRRSVRLDGEAGRQVEERYGTAAGVWDDAIWIPCADGKARRIKPGLEPLAHGIPGRVAALRGYGNAIVPQVAEIFIRAYKDCRMTADTQASTKQESK